MSMSRRTFLGASLAATTVAASEMPPTAEATDSAGELAFSPVGDLVGKITVGYQGWYGCAGDGQALGWWHTGKTWNQLPSADNETFWAWPDVRDYDHVYATGYPNLGNGQPASLFSNYDYQTVDTHFRWMQETSIDTVALQRFNPTGIEGPPRDAITAHVRTAAEKYRRKFYIMYDIGSWVNMQTEVKQDWLAKMSAYTASSAYARQNGRPVVGFWGFGFTEAHDFTPEVCLEVISWFQAQGCYVMGGVPQAWRDGVNDSRAGYHDVYRSLDALTPWMISRIHNAGDSDNFYNWDTVKDVAECMAFGVDYQPCVIPGDLNQRDRAHGDFMWRQFYNVIRAGSPAVFVAMFDEYNESNQIAKTAESLDFVPKGSKFIGLDEDGTKCTADYYMRLTGDGGRMLKGTIALTATRPTVPWID